LTDLATGDTEPMTIKAHAVALLLFLASSIFTYSVSTNFSIFNISVANGQPLIETSAQSAALDAYNESLRRFKRILELRRAQISSNQLPRLPGQALYLARVIMMSTYKDLTDAIPAKIGRPNKFGIPPAYFDADNESLVDEYKNLFAVMEAPPADAQSSDTPFEDVVSLGSIIARVKGLDATYADIAGRISLGIFFAETNGKQNIGNARSDIYKGSFQTGPSEDKSGQRKWIEIKASVAALDSTLMARDAKEEGRVGILDHRLNHWTAVRDGLMNAEADIFPKIPEITQALPDPIDQMKLFELIQIIRAALSVGKLASYKVSDPRVMKYLHNNSIFVFGHADQAKTSASFREILDAMWLFNEKFQRAISIFSAIREHKNQAVQPPL
jgi:hypothetical protein